MNRCARSSAALGLTLATPRAPLRLARLRADPLLRLRWGANLLAMTDVIAFQLNDQPVRVKVAPDRTLLWVLRTDLNLTGTKYGCGINQCGACTVLVDDKAVRSCSVEVGTVAGKKVTTIEGLARDGKLHPLQEAFVAHDALQCGFCTPGMILTAYSFLKRTPSPTRDQIIAAMNDNLCRCGAHPRIIDAIADAAKAMKGAA